MSSLRAFLRLEPVERRAVVLSIALAPAVKLLLRSGGFSRTQSLLPRFGWAVSISAERLYQLIQRIQRPRGILDLTCLERSVVMWSVLGEPAAVRFGLKPSADGTVPDFHAWIEVDGVAIGSDGHLGYLEFVPVTRPPKEHPPRPAANRY